MRALKYMTATGEVVGARTGDTMPPLPAGMAYIEAGAAVIADPTMKYVSGGVLKDRQIAALPTMTALVGESVAVAVPAGANWTVDGAFYIGPRSISFTTTGVHVIDLRGAWRGQTTITVTTLADLKAALIEKIDAANEARQAAITSPGTAKAYAYSRKAIEAADSAGILATALNALSLVDKKKKYPFASAEMALTGEALSVVLARYQAAYTASVAKKAAIEGAAIVAKAAVRAATTRASATAAAAVAWPT